VLVVNVAVSIMGVRGGRWGGVGGSAVLGRLLLAFVHEGKQALARLMCN
jgi:hypothetical protein